MAERIKLDPDDATPMSTYMQLVCDANMYPKGDCLPCGATIRMGFSSMRLAEVAILTTSRAAIFEHLPFVEAHRDNDDRHRPVNQFWFRFYYSGLGTPLNESAKANEWINAGVAAAKMGGKKALSGAESVAKSFTRVNTPIKQASVKTRVDDVKKQFIENFLEGIFRFGQSIRPSRIFGRISSAFRSGAARHECGECVAGAILGAHQGDRNAVVAQREERFQEQRQRRPDEGGLGGCAKSVCRHSDGERADRA